MAYKEIQTEEEFRQFFSLSTVAWKENEWPYEVIRRTDVKRFLVYEENEESPFGTFELLPYDTQKRSSVEDVFPFASLDEIHSLPGSVYELDKFSVVRSKRNVERFSIMLQSLFDVAYILQIERFFTLTKPSFFRLLSRFHLPMTQVGDPVYYADDKTIFIPVMIDAAYGVQHPEIYHHLVAISKK